MRRVIGVVALGAAGLVLAVALSFGAFALAGKAVGEPASAVRISTPATPRVVTDDRTSTATPPPSPAADDHSGGTSSPHSGGSSEPGDDHGGGEHHSDD